MNYSSQSGFKILVVDDEIDLESLIRQKFRRQIRDKVYDFVFAVNGLEALAKILEYPEIGIVLTDINMPEMDGLTLLAKLKELKNQGLKTVIVSAYGDMDNIRTAMNRGAYDFITKPVNFEDLEITINKTIDEIMQIRRSMEEHDQLVFIQHDLNIAREIQQAILPKIFSLFPEKQNFDLYASMVAAREVGGDFYDFFMIDDNRLGFVIGDVSGKGVPAAIFMAVSRTLIRATGIKGVSASDCMRYVNKLLCNESVASMFVTVFYGILDSTTGEVEFVNAGHNPPYLLNSKGIRKLEITGDTVLGVFDDITFHPGKIEMNPGEKLFLYTDGVTEAFNNQEEAYGEERLESLLKQYLEQPVDTIIKETMESVKMYVDEAPQSDDITLLSVTFYGQGR
ncbi:MAG: SpoIIE family protein phosphatase [Bacteroidales bacterium]|jgi:sigma-B regulation protein RsbU (phosphoserine phosphatase)|nr:SpoIIE family protein phosphatase [Bacteroidales bacterium]